MSDLTRDVQLRLSVKNNTQQDFKTLTDQVNTLTAAVKAETEAAATGTVKQAELAESLKRLTDAGKGIQQLAQDIQAYQNSFRQIEDAGKRLDAAAAKLNEFEASGSRNVRTLGRLQNAYGAAFSNLDRLTQQQTALATGLNNAGINTDDLAGEMTRLLTVADKAGAGIRTLDTAISNYTKNVRLHNEAEKERARVTAEATKKEQEQAAALKAVAEATERLNAERQKAGLVGVQAGTEELTKKAEERRKFDEETEKRRVDFIEKSRRDRLSAIGAEADADLRAFNKQRDDERAHAAEMEKLRQQSLAGLRGINSRAAAEQTETIRRNNEEQNRLREQQIIAEREAERRASLGRLGRLREDFNNARQLRRQNADEQARERQQSGRGFLGLRSYEITNLGYQATDVFQGFLSGVSPGVIAAQQGPQIFQIFGLAALKWSPIIVAALGAITVAVGAFSRAYREVASNREFNAAMQANVNSLNYNKEQLTALRKEARDMGMSWKDAGDSIKTAMASNVPQERLKEFLQAAQDAADLGKDTVPDAMKKFTEAFASSSDGILKLNESYNFLNPVQQRYVRDLIESGRTEQARIYALEKLTETLRKAAKEGLDPVTQSTRSLSQAWDDMLVSIGKSAPYNTAHTALVALIDDISSLFKEIDQIIKSKDPWSEFWARFWAAPMDPIKQGLTNLFRPTPAPQPGQTTPSATAADAGRAQLAPEVRRTNENIVRDFFIQKGYSPDAIAAIMGNISVESGFNPAAVGPGGHLGLIQWDQPRRARFGESRDINVQLEALHREIMERDRSFMTAAGSGLALRFEKNLEQSGGQKNELRVSETARYAGTAVQGAPTATQTQEGDKQVRQSERRRAIETAATIELERQARYREAEADINQRNIDDESKKKLISEERAKIDQDLFIKQQALEQKRESEKITFARHYDEVVAAGNKAVEEAQKRQQLNWEQIEQIRSQAQQKEFDRLSRIDQQNKAYDAAVKTVNDLERSLRGAFGPDMEGRLAARGEQINDLIKQLKEAREAATLTDRGRITEQITRVEGLRPLALFEERGKVLQEQARDAVAARDALIAANKAAQEAGAISISEQQERDKKAFELTKTAIDDATAALDEWIETGKKMGYSTIALEKTRSEVQKLRIESEYVDPLWKGLVKTAEDSFGTRAVEAFDNVAESIGNAIAKTKEWKDVWVDMGKAAANFFAGVLKDIASYIIKAELAKALSSFIPSLSGFPGAAAGAAASSIGTAGAGAAASTGMSAGWASILSGVAAVAHEGGVVGSSALPMRNAPGDWFAGAPKYHTGGIVGLAANEQQAILQKGEEVLTADNPRNIVNLTRNETHHEQPRDINIRNILVADPDLVPAHMGSARGEKVIMSVLTKNVATVRQLVR